jgi:hypothetical protein
MTVKQQTGSISLPWSGCHARRAEETLRSHEEHVGMVIFLVS